MIYENEYEENVILEDLKNEEKEEKLILDNYFGDNDVEVMV